jgi:hypothetical protein
MLEEKPDPIVTAAHNPPPARKIPHLRSGGTRVIHVVGADPENNLAPEI